MKYNGVPSFLWLIYKKSFEKNLVNVLDLSSKDAKLIRKKSKIQYEKIIAKLPEFESDDEFLTNIISCAMFIAFLLNLKKRPTVEEATKYYEAAMSTKLTKFFCKMKGKDKFSKDTIKGLIKNSKRRFADRNPYSWNYEFKEYPDKSGYENKFSKCGICKLMKEYGFFDLVPAMCHLDYVMSDFCKTTNFIREYTLASGGPYCDCGYKKIKKDL